MSTQHRTAHLNTNQFIHWLVFFLVSTLLALGPVVRGGNRQLALVVLLALGALLLALLASGATFEHFFDRPGTQLSAPQNHVGLWHSLLIAVVGTSPLWLGVLQLVPLPAALWSSLAGREAYLPALASAGAVAPTALPLSLNPDATWTALLSGVPSAAVFFAALALPGRLVDKALGVLLAVGACELALALLQFSQGSQSIFYFGMPGANGFVGSFANRNHLADFLAMLIPVWFYRLAQNQKHPTRAQSAHASRHQQVLAPFRLPLWLFFGFALLVLILSTLSRGGLIATTLVLLGSSLLWMLGLRKRLGRRQLAGLWTVVVLFSVLAISAVGLEGIGQRVDNRTLALDAQTRNSYTAATLEGARTFWPWGSGAGTFESVFPRFQALESLGYVEYAHNDYAQIAMELGLPGALIAAAVLALVLLQLQKIRAAYRAERRFSQGLALRSYCGLAAGALLVHSLVEFNMHIPALATTAAFFLGVYLRPLESVRQQPS